jgi:hypothetical protein
VKPWLRAPAAAGLLGLMAALLVASSLGKRLSWDENDNLAYGHRLLSRGVSPPASGQRMPVLALNALPCRADGCRLKALHDDEAGRLAVRAPTMALTLLLGLLVCRWCGELFGRGGAWLGLVLCVTNPTILAHGKQVTSDVATALFATLAAWAWWRLARDRGRPWANVSLVALGAAGALLSKYTSVLLFPAFLLLAVLEACRPAWRPRRWRLDLLARRAGQLAGAGALALVLVNAAYLFQGTFTPASEHEWTSRSLGFLREVPLPLFVPRVYALGLDLSARIQEQPGLARGYNYVLGELNADGRSWAFPLMILLKTPLGVFALAAVGARRWPSRAPGALGDAAIVALPGLVLLGFYSLVAAPQLGIRYVLPVLPLLIVAAAAAARQSAPPARLAVLVLAGWSVASALSYHPHYMSYFNELVGPRKNAWRFLADSNLDWEDRARDIERFRTENPGIDLAVDPAEPRAGYLLVSANRLVGLYDPEEFRWLREGFAPLRHVGHSYLLFHVRPDALAEALARHPPGASRPGLPALPDPGRRD